MSTEEAIAVVRRNTEEVQGKGNYEIFEELFAQDFVDHTPQPGGFSADRDGARNLYKVLRTAFPDFHAEIHWQISDGDRVISAGCVPSRGSCRVCGCPSRSDARTRDL